MADKAQTDWGLQLPAPSSDPDDPIVAMFKRRKTTRDIGPAPLPMYELSKLLWSAFGVNRNVGPFGAPGRTAGSASNAQEIDLDVALANGAYRYDALNCRLALVTRGESNEFCLLNPLAIPRNAGRRTAASLCVCTSVRRSRSW